MKEPDNLFFDHTPSKNSTPESTLRMAHNIIAFKKEQIKRYKLAEDRYGLCRWDIFYTHVTKEVLDFLVANRMRVVIVPPNMTDGLQQMDKGVNAPLKAMLKKNYTTWRSDQSIHQMAKGISAEDVFVKFGLKALKTIHVKWVASAWKYIEEQGFISKSFELVDDNLIGYTHWNEDWILNEYAKNGFEIKNDDAYDLLRKKCC